MEWNTATQRNAKIILENKAEVENNSNPIKNIFHSQHIRDNQNKLTCKKWPVISSRKVRTKKKKSKQASSDGHADQSVL